MNNELLLRYYYYQDSFLLRYHDSYTPLKGSIEESIFLRKNILIILLILMIYHENHESY